jgi:hypothetical protein
MDFDDDQDFMSRSSSDDERLQDESDGGDASEDGTSHILQLPPENNMLMFHLQ